jgi:aquaporin NIP
MRCNHRGCTFSTLAGRTRNRVRFRIGDYGHVCATGHLSGAHINPAVTVAFTVTRHFPARDAIAYVAAQLTGAITGALLLLVLWPSKPAHLGATLPSVPIGNALIYEMILTAVLMFVIMAVATDTRAQGAAAAMAIGGAVCVDALFDGPITGASMNPARTLGPAIVTGQFDQLWIYIVGPVIGATLGAFAYQLVRGAQRQPITTPDVLEETFGARPVRLPA